MKRNRARLMKLARQEMNRRMDEWDGRAFVTMLTPLGPRTVPAEDYQRHLAIPMMNAHDRLPDNLRRAECEGFEIEVPLFGGLKR
jgi:hypothetical protein